MKPVGGKPLHCDPVPPCPCPEWEQMERGSSQGSGNAWGEEIGDEVSHVSRDRYEASYDRKFS